jgi:hypothetical protein
MSSKPSVNPPEPPRKLESSKGLTFGPTKPVKKTLPVEGSFGPGKLPAPPRLTAGRRRRYKGGSLASESASVGGRRKRKGGSSCVGGKRRKTKRHY